MKGIMQPRDYTVVDVLPVVYLDRRPSEISRRDLRALIYRWVVASAALYRYARLVGGIPCSN